MDSVHGKGVVMHQILKIFGVSPDALARLHKVLEGDSIKAKTQIRIFGDVRSMENPFFANLLSSKYSTEDKSYIVEIKIHMKIRGFDPKFDYEDASDHPIVLSAPLNVLTNIYEALGDDLFPAKEIAQK